MRFAYNTNGLQSHRLEEALDLIASSGFAGVALTLDHMHLDPVTAGPVEVGRVRRALETRKLACGIETGARFLLEPRGKHKPTLIDADAFGRARRLSLTLRMIELAGELGAETVTLASGPRDKSVSEDVALLFLRDALEKCVEKAREVGVTLALEPEPGHLPSTLEGWKRIRESVPVSLALDVTHLSVDAPEPPAHEAVKLFGNDLAVVHLADSPRGVHDHRPLGEGDLELAPLLAALETFPGMIAVELSRHSHAAHELVPKTMSVLAKARR